MLNKYFTFMYYIEKILVNAECQNTDISLVDRSTSSSLGSPLPESSPII